MSIWFLLLLLWLAFGMGAPVAKGGSSRSPERKLTRRRLIKEFKDIKKMGLSLMDSPFNGTVDELGVRLHPTSNLFEWHFSFLGPPDSVYEGGVYHGRIFLPREYPRKAPQITICTPNGRWEVGKFICLSATAFHQETWDTSWNLRTLVLALRGHMLTQPLEIGGISTPPERRADLARASQNYACPLCGVKHADLLDSSYCGQHEHGKTSSSSNHGARHESHLTKVPRPKETLTRRVVAKEIQVRVRAERALQRQRRERVVRHLALMVLAVLVSKIINALGLKSVVSISFST